MSDDLVDRLEHKLKRFRAAQGRLALLIAEHEGFSSPCVDLARAFIAAPSNEARDGHLKKLLSEILALEHGGVTKESFLLRGLSNAFLRTSDEFRDGDEFHYVGWTAGHGKDLLGLSDDQVEKMFDLAFDFGA